MRLSLHINGKRTSTASLPERGWVSAHLNLSRGIGDEDSNKVYLNSIDCTEEPNATHFHLECSASFYRRQG